MDLKSGKEVWIWVYYVAQMKENGKFGYHLMYYDLETGETGVIY